MIIQFDTDTKEACLVESDIKYGDKEFQRVALREISYNMGLDEVSTLTVEFVVY